MKFCTICGEEFKEKRSNQMYCPECGKKPEQVRRCYAKHERELKRHMGVYDEPKERECPNCGRMFETLFNRRYCSKTCQREYIVKTAECSYCYENFLKRGIKIDAEKLLRGGVHFCSRECHDNYYLARRAEKVEPPRICPYCKKEFYGKKTTFCSNDCYVKAKADGWKPPKPPSNHVSMICGRCKKTFDTYINSPVRLCPECMRKAEKEHKKAKQEQQREERERQKAARYAENGLCFYCQTPNYKCEHAKSNYIYYPKGAKVESGKVRECPQFSER